MKEDLYWENGASIWADAELYYEDLLTMISFPENTVIPSGSYTFYKFEGGYNMGTSSLVRGFFRIGYGTFYDGTRGELGISALWNISRHLGLYVEYGANFIRFPKRVQSFGYPKPKDKALTDLHVTRYFTRHGNIILVQAWPELRCGQCLGHAEYHRR